jgi:glutamine synthetase
MVHFVRKKSMNARFEALKEIQKRSFGTAGGQKNVTFGQGVFDKEVMEKVLPGKIWAHLKEVIQGREKLDPVFSPQVAEAMKEWAISNGATHFCHWFQPLTGFAAEKHDAFYDWNVNGELIEKLGGSQLMRGEPDASSFPHGGLRSTAEARGYTAWDPTSFPFLWGMGTAKVLCIPSIFFSWSGLALDMKIPLMRSEAKLNAAALRFLNLFDVKANTVYSTLGCEQEYFLIDKAWYDLRPDLLMAGRTLCGSSSARGQELEDHYFGAIKERVSAFCSDLEQRALSLGIPLRTRHAEVAPGQFEFAPLFERASAAVDHNVLLMELMRQVASRHQLVCLLHEKPFARVNGSGKHCNWSLATDTGLNLLDPGQPELQFLVMLAAVLDAVYQHSSLLRGAIAVPGNDHRLGGHEAPPAIISVYLGESLERWVRGIEEDRAHQNDPSHLLNLGLPSLPDIPLDETDRNRTSPFAFTGNKFEFRAVGASQHCALPVTVLNVAVAKSLNQIVDEMEKELMKKRPLKSVALKVACKFLKKARAIRFTGDNYSSSWRKEAKKRELPHLEKSVDAFDAFLSPKSIKAFEGVLSKKEIESRVAIMYDRYCKTLHIEASVLVEIFQTQILPAAFQFQKEVAESIRSVSETGHSVAASQSSLIKKISQEISLAIDQIHLLEKEARESGRLSPEMGARLYSGSVAPKAEAARKTIDGLESMIDDRLWPLPKYREMLHVL